MAVNTQDIIDELNVLLAQADEHLRNPEIVTPEHLNVIRNALKNPTLDQPLMATHIKNLTLDEKTKFINQILNDPSEQEKWRQLAKTDAELQKEAEEAAQIAAEKLAAEQQQAATLAAQQAALAAAEQQRILAAQQQAAEAQRTLLLQQQQQVAQEQQLEQARAAVAAAREQRRQASIAAAKAGGFH